MTRYLIGIDNGSQSSKVTVYDENGRVHAEGQVPLQPNHTAGPGIVEHPGDDLWESISQASRIALADFPGNAADIAGVGLCSIRFCRAILRWDGSLAQPVQSWMDARVSRPFQAETHDAAYVTTSSGYLTHRLTGHFRDTVANYQGMWPVDTAQWAWSTNDDDYERTGIHPEQLFELVGPGEVLGTVTAEAAAHTGLPQGLPVVSTANDKAVEALGAGLREPSSLLVSLGTYIAGMTVGNTHVQDPQSFWTNFGSEPGVYLYESHGIRRGMWTVSWFRDLIGDDGTDKAVEPSNSLEGQLNRGADIVPPGSDGLLTVLDWLAPTEAPYRKGSVLGFDVRHGRNHMYRSILESIAMTMKDSCDAMVSELGTSFDQVTVSGGGASSDVMMQIMADVFEVESVRMNGPSAAAKGAAICAAVATGVAPTFEAAVAAMASDRDSFSPNIANSQIYRQLGEVLRNVRTYTDPIFERTARIVD